MIRAEDGAAVSKPRILVLFNIFFNVFYGPLDGRLAIDLTTRQNTSK